MARYHLKENLRPAEGPARIRKPDWNLSDGEEGFCLFFIATAIVVCMVLMAVRMDSLKDRTRDRTIREPVQQSRPEDPNQVARQK